MPDVPNLPGVPPLSSYSPNGVGLAIADVPILLNAFLGPVWGIYIDGAPVILPASIFTQAISPLLGAISTVASLIGFPNVVPVIASTVSFDFSADSPISNYPQEKGAFQSYDKVQLPFDIKLKLACGGSASVRQAFFSTLEALRTSTALVDIVTPEAVYSSCNCKHVDYARTASNGVDLIIADVWFEQVRVGSALTFSNTQNPGDAGQQSIGNVQPVAPSSAISQQFAGIGGAPY